MSFAELTTDMTEVCFQDLGERALYTAPSVGAVAVACLAVVDEPNEDPFARQIPGAKFTERKTTLWLFRSEVPAAIKDGTVVVTTSHGVVRSFVLTSLMFTDPDRTQWAVREVMA